ncbi:MAG TPA: cupin domain-containing protein [Microthrixaceae bacterium]|nr:cupin domain-containing protein [Microthrixaceae bacterium]
MASITMRTFDDPDETRRPDKTQMDIVDLGTAKVARLTAQPGWTWSECIRPIAGTDSCQTRHVGVVQSGSLTVTHDDGTEMVLTAGNVYVIEPGHDARNDGDQPFVALEFESHTAEMYAKDS